MGGTRRGIAVGAALVIGMTIPVAAQGPAIEEVVSGLNSPRGVALGPDGTLYVVEAGVGGEAPCAEHAELGNMCFGNSGVVHAIADGSPTVLVDGLPSGITDTGEVIGPSDVTVDADGAVWFLVGGPAAGSAEFREAIPDGAGEGLGWLYRVGDGGAEPVADFAAYETESNPDAEQPGNAEPDSNVHGLAAAPNGALVADAGGNTLLMVGGDGSISTAAVFPVAMMPMPADPNAEPDPDAEPQMIPMDPVPTSVAVGPDGAAYVGMLTGFPFPAGGSAVHRVAEGEEPTAYAEGFTNVIDLEFGADGTLYVLEISHAGLANVDPEAGPPMGGLWMVPAGGGEPVLITSEGLAMPGGLAVADDGTIYVSTCTVCAGGGAVVSVTP